MSGPEFGWLERIREEVAMHSPPCPECKMRTFHLDTCSHSALTRDDLVAAKRRRELVDGKRERWLKAVRNTCVICKLTILPGEDRAFGPPPRHRDCQIDFEEHLSIEHYEDSR